MIPAKDPKQQNRIQNRVQIGFKIRTKATIMIMFFQIYCSKGREYSHWIDLTLNSHFKAFMPESCRTKVRCMSTQTFRKILNVGERSIKVQWPQHRLLGSTRHERDDLTSRRGREGRNSRLLSPLMVNKENGKWNRDPPPPFPSFGP